MDSNNLSLSQVVEAETCNGCDLQATRDVDRNGALWKFCRGNVSSYGLIKLAKCYVFDSRNCLS